MTNIINLTPATEQLVDDAVLATTERKVRQDRRVLFTKAWLDAITVEEPTNFTDLGCRGLQLRVTPEGSKTFSLFYRSRITGKPKNTKVGSYPAIGLAGNGSARELVNKAWEQIEQPGNTVEPTFATTAKKNEDGTVALVTVADAFAKFDAEKIVNLKQGRNNRSSILAVIKRHNWATRPLASLTRIEVRAALEHIVEVRKSPKQALNTQSMLSGFFSWACDAGLIKDHPIARMRGIVSKGKARNRHLSPAEIQKVWDACQNPERHGLSQDHADAILLVLTTSARPGMICALRLSLLVNLDANPLVGHNGGPSLEVDEFGLTRVSTADARAYADLPGAKQGDEAGAWPGMKKGRDFVLPLNATAVAIIKRRIAAGLTDGGLVFPTRSVKLADKGKFMSRDTLADACEKLSARFGWTAEGEGHGSPFHPHDLRRTGAYWLNNAAPAGLEPYSVERVGQLLSHEEEGSKVTQGYTAATLRFRFFTLKREVSDRLADMLGRFVNAARAEVRLAA